jgi:uncharacterized protein YndB with AHSA1/START domain
VPFETDRHYDLAVPPAALWASLAQVDRYQSWWPWLRRFDGAELAAGEAWHCLVQPPLPYRVRFTVHLEEVEAPHRVAASVSGDVAGQARVEVAAAGTGSRVRFVSQLDASNGWLKAVARWASPLAGFGHDWVMDAGARQFLDRAI